MPKPSKEEEQRVEEPRVKEQRGRAVQDQQRNGGAAREDSSKHRQAASTRNARRQRLRWPRQSAWRTASAGVGAAWTRQGRGAGTRGAARA